MLSISFHWCYHTHMYTHPVPPREITQSWNFKYICNYDITKAGAYFPLVLLIGVQSQLKARMTNPDFLGMQALHNEDWSLQFFSVLSEKLYWRILLVDMHSNSSFIAFVSSKSWVMTPPFALKAQISKQSETFIKIAAICFKTLDY